MLHLTSHGLLAHASRGTQHGLGRSSAIAATSFAVGLAAGKLEDARVTPIAAVGIGFLASAAGLPAFGDGAMGGGAAIFGYKLGARHARRHREPRGVVTLETPRVTRHRERPTIARR